MNTHLERLYAEAREKSLQPLWIDTGKYTPRHPDPKVVAAHWSGREVVSMLQEAGEIASEHADRRVLVCNNPGLPPFSGTTQTMFACIQLLKAGERASMHRHSQSAFRFVMDGEGSHTVLNGEPFHMRRGDFIVTPAWTWHGHRNDSANEMVWLDGLDSGILRLFDATFFELPHADTDDDDPAKIERFGRESAKADPHWHFKWEDVRGRLDAARSQAPDASLGYQVRYLHPQTQADPIPTIAAYLNFLPGGFAGVPYKSSDSAVYLVVSGRGQTRCGTKTIAWAENDVFTIPTWEAYRHQAGEDAVLFSFSDRGAQERLGCWREQRG